MKNINSRIAVFFSFVLLMLFMSAKESFQSTETKSSPVAFSNALRTNSIQLKDGESHTIESDFLYNVEGYGKSKIIGFTSRDFLEKPFVIRSYEKHPSDFELLTNYTLDNFIDQLFYPGAVISGEYSFLFYNYKSIHLNSLTSPFSSDDLAKYDIWRNRLGSDPDHFSWLNTKRYGQKEEDIDLLVKVFGGGHADFVGQQSWPLTFFHGLMKEKVARDAVFKFIVSSYKKVEGNIPRTSKEDMLSLLKKLGTFLELEIIKIKLENPNDQWPAFIIPPGMNLDYYKEFLARRMLIDKIPLTELKLYFKEFKTMVETSIATSKVTNIASLQVNNDLIIADANSRELMVSSLHSSNQFKIKTGEEIYVKCLVDNNAYYYQFERNDYGGNEFLGLYNARLEVIRPPIKK